MTRPRRPLFPKREAECHKGQFGTALIVGGSRGMSGAAALAGMAALRGGAGLVRVATPDCVLDIVAQLDPCYITVGLLYDENGLIDAAAVGRIEEQAAISTCVAVGPGLGRSPGLDQLVTHLYESLATPAVFDADALNALAGKPLPKPAGPRVFTPHIGEMKRLAERDLPDREAADQAARQYAAENGLVVLLKGSGSLITDGQQDWVNTTGSPAMATGGAGDVLTGLIAALICQGFSPFHAAQLGAYWHGYAGQLAAREQGQLATTALDILRQLGPAHLELTR